MKLKWLVVLCLLASSAHASSRWTISRQGQPIELDVTRTPTGYRAFPHQDKFIWSVQWGAIPCPNDASEGTIKTNDPLMELTRQPDGTFSVVIAKAYLVPVGASGLGTPPIAICQITTAVYTAKFLDRAHAMTIDAAQTNLFPASREQFLVMDMGRNPCPVPEANKYTCGIAWPVHIIVDVTFEDSDGDGINDEWEVGGIRDGTNWLDLKSMGADPDHKDLFIQMDSTSETGYPDTVLREVRDYFVSLPVTNPDGRTGINLHLDAGQLSLMNGSTRWGSKSAANENVGIGDVFTTGGCNATDKGPLTNLMRSLDPLRAKVFRYIVLAKWLVDVDGQHPCSGMNWNIPSKAFVVGDWASSGIAPDHVLKGLLLHELGHSLGLYHAGGTPGPYYKPNYQSVMNYGYQELGIPLAGHADEPGLYMYSSVDPSRTNSIDENTLSDETGLPNVGMTGTLLVYTCRPPSSLPGDATLKIVAPGTAADFRCDGSPHSPAPNDITFTDGSTPAKLDTYNDVAHLHLPLEDGPSTFGAGAGRQIAPEDRSIAKALQDYGTRIGDTQAPTVKLSLKKKGKKRQLTIKAHDDKGLSSAIVTVGTTKTVVKLAKPDKKRKTWTTKDATQTVDIDATGDITVVVTDITDKSGTATAK